MPSTGQVGTRSPQDQLSAVGFPFFNCQMLLAEVISNWKAWNNGVYNFYLLLLNHTKYVCLLDLTWVLNMLCLSDWVKYNPTWRTPKPSQSPTEPPTSERKLLNPGLTKSVLVTRTFEINLMVTIVWFWSSLKPETNLELVVKVRHEIGQSEVS